jgi:NADH:ubiquinone oxidoreductase subunit 5 (subunit L)/multisubunit Na+/H+ antiporter MnhA subunit
MITVALTAAYTVRFIGMTFYGPESQNLAHLHEKNSPPHEALKSMWGACAVLAFFIIVLGVFGPKVEHLLKHGFHINLVEHLQLPLGHAEHGPINYHLLVTILSVASILAGAVPAYFLYVSRSWTISYNRASLLHEVHEFCWNRWYINGFYNKVFVEGTLKLARIVSEKIENPYDRLAHHIIPKLVSRGLPKLAFKLQTESENMLYVGAYIMVVLVGALFIALL